jgi:glycosidase
LDQIPDDFLSKLSSQGFDWLWILGVWTISPEGLRIARSLPELQAELLRILPDLSSSDVCGSPFAIAEYIVDPALGGNHALERLRKRMNSFGLKLMLDFVPNHLGLDHKWTSTDPDFFIQGTSTQIEREPSNWTRLRNGRIFAHGRDPNYPGWPDTLQLNYYNPELQQAMRSELLKISELCDGVRCDMAMLLEPDVFSNTWRDHAAHSGEEPPHFWPVAISAVKEKNPDFKFLAETYWDYEYKLQGHGFDFTYDKRLYDRVLLRRGPDVRAHLEAPLSFQSRMARFLENHDEARVASMLSVAEHRAAAAVTYLSPGMRFFFDGQLSGRRTRTPVQLGRAPREKIDQAVAAIYHEILPVVNSLPVKHGTWNLLDTKAAWPDNHTHSNFIAFLIEHPIKTLLVVVNYASYRGQCFIRVPDRSWLDGSLELRDILSHERLVRNSNDLRERGLFLDCAEWQTHIFSIEHS